jgi:hypothetical protein
MRNSESNLRSEIPRPNINWLCLVIALLGIAFESMDLLHGVNLRSMIRKPTTFVQCSHFEGFAFEEDGFMVVFLCYLVCFYKE